MVFGFRAGGVFLGEGMGRHTRFFGVLFFVRVVFGFGGFFLDMEASHLPFIKLCISFLCSL